MAFIRNGNLPALLLLLAAVGVRADETSWDFAANVEVQSRFFTEDARWSGQDGSTGQPSLAAAAELRWRNAAGNQRVSVIPYVRWDAADEERSSADLREAYWAWEADSLELLVGANTVFWGVTESAHLVDIINQTDTVADIDGEDKLGQPMINLAIQRDWGLISLFALPYFRERPFAGIDGRLRAPLPVDTGRPVFESSQEKDHVDFALRYAHYIGDVDLGLSVFSGTSREPRLVPAADGATLVPHYDLIGQAGVDLQYTGDAWLWKLEAIVRDGYAETFAAAVGGVEYTFYQIGESAADIGLLVEYQYDGRGELEPLTLADNDVFLATRIALNDVQDTTVLAGLTFDTKSNETFVNVEAERRLGDDYVFELRARFFSGAGPQDAAFAIARDDYLQLQLTRYF